jgi:membrane-associated phospholipid phosphatase
MLVGIVVSFVLASSPAARPLKWDPRIDLPVVGVTLAGWVSSEFALKSTLAPKACRWCETNPFDTEVRRVFNPSLAPSAFGLSGPDAASNVLLALTPLSVLGLDVLLSWRDGVLEQAPIDVALIAEAMLIAMCVNQVTKFVVGRERPYTVGASAALLDVPGQSDHFISFFSGHTTFTFAAVAAAATITSLRGYRLAWLTWVVGAPLAFTTAVLRLAADKHWATDVLVGMVAGAGIDIAVPLLFHGVADQGVRVQVSAMPGGLALSGTF